MKKFLFTMLLAALASSTVSAKSLADIRNSGVVRVGVFEDEAPFSKLTDGTYEGFEVNLAQAIAKKIFGDKSGRVEFTSVRSDDRVKALQEDRVDFVTATLEVTSEREKAIDFSTPYFSVNVGVLTRKADKVMSVKDLVGKTILAEPSSTAWAYFEKQGYKIESCETAGACYRALRDGRGDGYADDNIIVLAYPVLDRKVEVNVKNLGNSEFIAVGVQKGNTELLGFIDDALIALSSDGFFKDEFENHISPYYKGTAEKKFFLLDDLYSLF